MLHLRGRPGCARAATVTPGERAEALQIRERIAGHPYGPLHTRWVFLLELDGNAWVLRVGDPRVDVSYEWRFPRFSSESWFCDGLSEAAEDYLETLRVECHADPRPEA